MSDDIRAPEDGWQDPAADLPTGFYKAEQCFCCDSLDTKRFGTITVHQHDHPAVEQDLWQCREHYIHCYHTPWTGPDGQQDWDGDEPEYLAYVEVLGAEWDAAP